MEWQTSHEHACRHPCRQSNQPEHEASSPPSSRRFFRSHHTTIPRHRLAFASSAALQCLSRKRAGFVKADRLLVDTDCVSPRPMQQSRTTVRLQNPRSRSQPSFRCASSARLIDVRDGLMLSNSEWKLLRQKRPKQNCRPADYARPADATGGFNRRSSSHLKSLEQKSTQIRRRKQQAAARSPVMEGHARPQAEPWRCRISPRSPATGMPQWPKAASVFAGCTRACTHNWKSQLWLQKLE